MLQLRMDGTTTRGGGGEGDPMLMRGIPGVAVVVFSCVLRRGHIPDLKARSP